MKNGTPRTASIVAMTNSSMVKIDKTAFDKYAKNIFENQLQDLEKENYISK